MGDKEITEEAVCFFKDQFNGATTNSELSLLQYIHPQVEQHENDRLNALPQNEEIRKVVFELNAESSCGLDGFTGHFYQTCWDIVGSDIVKVVHAFFQGYSLSKSITLTSLVILPKKDTIQSFSDFRPINLSNFLNKIITRLIHDKLEGILPKLISPNQSRFVKGRNITENVVLAQEIISEIRKRGEPANVVMNMDKAYDRVD